MRYAATPLRLPEHRDALARLWAENMSDPGIAAAVPERMRWLYELGPEGPPTTVLVVVEETGEPVGCGSILPRATWVGGRRLAAGLLCDFAITRAHRNAGAALTVQRALAEAGRARGLELVYGYPNDRSIAVFQRIGYRVVGRSSTWVKPLRSGYKLRQALPGALAAAAAAPADLCLRALDALRGRGAGTLAGEALAPPDARWDALWERARGQHGVIPEKTAPYLDWRYRRFPTVDHRVFAVEGPGDALGGYAVATVEGGKAFVRDLLAGPEPRAVEAVLLGVAARLRADRVDSILLSYVGAPELGQRLRAMGFVPRSGERPLVVDAGGLDERLRAEVMDPGRWFMLDGELDL